MFFSHAVTHFTPAAVPPTVPSVDDHIRPWHGLMFAAFCLGAGLAVREVDTTAGLGPEAVFLPVMQGLLAVVAFQFTVGSVWSYAVEYRNHGGDWTDHTLLAPFALAVFGGLAAVAVGFANSAFTAVGFRDTAVAVLGTFLTGAFWTFVLAAVVVNLAAQALAGYTDATKGDSADETGDGAESGDAARDRERAR